LNCRRRPAKSRRGGVIADGEFVTAALCLDDGIPAANLFGNFLTPSGGEQGNIP
jgi:hypothetical protein